MPELPAAPGFAVFREPTETAVLRDTFSQSAVGQQSVCPRTTEPLKRGYLTGAPGVVWKPPNSFRPSGMVTVRALATSLPSFAP
jgi:hypothetical protein